MNGNTTPISVRLFWFLLMLIIGFSIGVKIATIILQLIGG